MILTAISNASAIVRARGHITATRFVTRAIVHACGHVAATLQASTIVHATGHVAAWNRARIFCLIGVYRQSQSGEQRDGSELH